MARAAPDRCSRRPVFRRAAPAPHPLPAHDATSAGVARWPTSRASSRRDAGHVRRRTDGGASTAVEGGAARVDLLQAAALHRHRELAARSRAPGEGNVADRAVGADGRSAPPCARCIRKAAPRHIPTPRHGEFQHRERTLPQAFVDAVGRAAECRERRTSSRRRARDAAWSSGSSSKSMLFAPCGSSDHRRRT